MKLFGPRSLSFFIHTFFKIIYYLSLVLGSYFTISLLMGVLHYWGFSNPIASLELVEDGFNIFHKITASGPMFIPLLGITGYLQYSFSLLFGIFIYIFSCRLLALIFKSLSGETIFVESLVRHTKSLGLLYLIITGIKLIAFFFDTSHTIFWSDWGFILFAGIMFWFLSKVFEEGYKLQEELNLTI